MSAADDGATLTAMGIRLGFSTERQTVLTLAALSALLTAVLTAPALVAALTL